jgi:hypothetical protein
MKINELEMFISRVERGVTNKYDADWFRQWLREQPGYQMDVWTGVLAAIGILVLMILAVNG